MIANDPCPNKPMPRLSHHKVQRYLNRPDGELDLHGFRVAEAGVELRRFLYEAGQRDWLKVRIITGRGLNSPDGRSVLKAYVKEYLSDEGYRFREAKGPEGGAGALIVDVS